MILKNFLGFVAMAMIIGSAAVATSGIPELNLTWASRAYTGPESCVMFNLPNGGGSPFNTVAIIFVGGTVDGTITLYLRDGNNDPIADYPREDLWLESDSPGVFSCPGGSIADANTDFNGQTTWVYPLRAGGSREGSTVVMISGGLMTSGSIDISHNSPDINGDLAVNLTDVAMFASDYYTGYSFRSDFQHDGVINLADVAKFASSIGAACP